MKMLSVCNDRVTVLLPCPKMYDPRNNKNAPENSTSQPRIVMWILMRFRRCRMAFDESDSNLLSLIIDSF